MTIDADIRDQAYEFFIQEAPELLLVIETELVTLSQDRSTNKIHNMMRAAHSLKGGSASVGLPIISELSHKLEDFFKTLHHPELEIDSELEDLFLLAFDCLKLSVTEQIETGSIDPNYIAEVMAPTLGRIEAKLGDFLGSETELPNSIDLGVDIALSIFEVDVAEGLERLREILDSPQNHIVAGELRAQAEVFSGISELLNMPGLGAIAQATINALDANPSMVTEIAHYAMQDFEAARQGVIAGDRTQGGYPSEQLLELSNAELSSLDFSDLDALLNDSPDRTNIFAEERTDLDLMFADPISYSERNDEVIESTPISDELSLDELFGQISLDTDTSDNQLDEQLSSIEDMFGDNSSLDLESDIQSTVQIDPQINLDDVFGESEAITDIGLDDLFGGSLNLESLNESISSGDRASYESENVLEESVRESEDKSEEQIAVSMDDVFGEDSSFNFNSSFDDVFASETVVDNLSLDDVFRESVPLEDSEPTFIQDNSIQDIFVNKQVSELIDRDIAIGKEQIQDFPISETISPSVVAKSAIAPAQSITPKKTSYTSNTTPSAAVAADSQLSVRINLDRLEQMNNLVGELAINRNVLSLQNEQLQNIVQELLRRFGKFRQITNRLRTVADQTASGDRYGNRSSNQVSSISTSDFDSLELDTYGELYGVMQTALEDLAQIEETVEDVTLLSGQSVQTLEQQRQTVTRLRDDLMWARMLPLSEVLNRFPRNIRDLSSKYQKPVDLKLSGTGVLVDKAILEKLADPLQHLLRNAFDHGIELPATRLNQQKSERGQIEIRAYHQGSQTIIEVRDDGQGINLEQIRRKAIAQSLITAEQEFSERELLDLMFQPGFSTTDKVSELSGRGVGLDVVRSQIQALKGTVSVGFERGKGTTFTLRIPLTLSIANLLICTVGTSVFAIASSSIEEIVVPKLSQVSHSGERRLLQWREQTIPIRHLSEFLDFRCPLPESLPNSSLVSVPTPSDWALPLLIIRSDRELLALEIDRLITEQELVIKPLGLAIAPPKFIYGCTILGDGSLIPILNSQELLEQVDLDSAIPIAPKINAPIQSDTLLIVDDSIALRQTLALTLQKAGFRVLQAKDGLEAIEQLEKNSTIQLVVCDIEMPNMNGFEFLTARRQNPNLNKTPVIMLTSRSSDKHRRLAMHLGASSYFTKPYLEREFITAIKNTLTPLVLN
jgi:two-component system, chemotaxis family, sensor histidine kinase and response regulator PixL